MTPRESFQSCKEVGGIFVDAGKECFYDARKWLGKVITDGLDKLDERAANAVNGPEDE